MRGNEITSKAQDTTTMHPNELLNVIHQLLVKYI